MRWGSHNSNENKIYVYFIVCAGDHFRSLLESFSGSETIFCGILIGRKKYSSGSLNLGWGQPASERLYGWAEPGPGDSLGFRAGLCPSPMVLGLSPHSPLCFSSCACPANHFFKLSIGLIEALLYLFWDQISFLMTKDKSYLSFVIKSAKLCQLKKWQQQCYLPSLFIA